MFTSGAYVSMRSSSAGDDDRCNRTQFIHDHIAYGKIASSRRRRGGKHLPFDTLSGRRIRREQTLLELGGERVAHRVSLVRLL